MDCTFACSAGGPGWIPAVGIVGSSINIWIIFLPLRSKVVGKKWNCRGLAFPECSESKKEKILGPTYCKSKQWYQKRTGLVCSKQLFSALYEWFQEGYQGQGRLVDVGQHRLEPHVHQDHPLHPGAVRMDLQKRPWVEPLTADCLCYVGLRWTLPNPSQYFSAFSLVKAGFKPSGLE